MERPKVRFLNVQPFGDRFLITDPLGISESMVVSKELLIIMSLMDGTRTKEEIKLEFLRITGQILTEEDLSRVIDTLDRGLYLLSDRFRERLDAVRRKLLSSGVRKPAHAGVAYPDDPDVLKKFLEESLTCKGDLKPKGILVPHMDLRVARKTYGAVYSRIDGSWVRKVVILGVSHYFHEKPMSVCPLDFETPLGSVKVDREVVRRLKEKFDYDLEYDILSHLKEHSIEFQTLYVKLLFPEAEIVPIIVSYGEPEELKVMSKNILDAVGSKEGILVISSVDMSHVGKKFGDRVSYDPSWRDKEYIKLLCQMKNEEAFELLRKDENSTRIDGQFTNFVFVEMMKLLGSRGGELIDYAVYQERETDSRVSYAGIVFL